MPIDVCLSAFGPFGMYDVNPSEAVANGVATILSYLPTRGHEHVIRLLDCRTLPVAVRAVNDYVDELQLSLFMHAVHSRGDGEEGAPPPPLGKSVILLIHFGVDSRLEASRTSLETRAVNDLHVPDGDVGGYCCIHEKICKRDIFTGGAPPEGVSTTIPPDMLAEACEAAVMGPSGRDGVVHVSDDAGTYLCNYLYFRSVLLCASLQRASEGRTSLFSLFVHVNGKEDVATQTHRVGVVVVELLKRLAQ